MFVDHKFKFLAKLLKDIHSKVGEIAKRVDVKIDFHVNSPDTIDDLHEISDRCESDRVYAHSLVINIFNGISTLQIC